MIIKANVVSIIVGEYQDPQHLINLPFSEPLDFDFQLPNGQHIASLMAHGLSTENQFSRLIELLHKLPILNEEQWQPYRHQPVYWILPNLEQRQLIDFVARLHALLPHCFEHPQSRFFPMGSAGVLSALNTLKATDSDTTGATFIALDSLFFELDELGSNNELISQQQDSGRCPAEAVIMASINLASDGLQVDNIFQESCSSVQQTQTIKTLFDCVSQLESALILSQLYLPGHQANVTDNWLNAYEHLAGSIDQYTKIIQSSYFTGDIGCAAGLYNFLHIYHRYQQQNITGTSLQLEVSQQLHLGLAMYSWIEKA
ncbi:hypothetical protein [Shewanella ulleungensis]|uniref:DUF2877 domain-containing protein n=1 Tax=Shewanella ulleungensis TaxID=2282699 RepID=A0ABQ2QCE7_9GAMM|nr:hypothetical protein [Shewanella ulleungensis]MCL1149157.1 hypothetical protein [Shewanella ulleungensis]GGP73188.1 hypothetical protein GCM10009410_00900 [Shewanella ulleungensis]